LLTLNILQYYIISSFFLFDLDIHRCKEATGEVGEAIVGEVVGEVAGEVIGEAGSEEEDEDGDRPLFLIVNFFC